MAEPTENAAEVFLEQLIGYTSFALEIIVAIIIIIIVGITIAGLVRIFLSSLKKKEEGERRPTLVHQLVTRMLRGLLIALDFLVAADILKTILVPSANELAILVIVVVIRILLNWSLSKEIEGQPR
ncbi:MAG TPA: DUF1622 domain-containing protein [Nitrososphaeraceae archaeon]|nr:DUF1622 domain-containing protein [Nitrososphaeraceae archaeon]